MNSTITANAGVPNHDAVRLVYFFAALLAGVVLLPGLLDTWKAYKARSSEMVDLQTVIQNFKGTLDEQHLERLVKIVAEGPGGISGLSRAVMALSVITLLGFVLFFTLAVPLPAGSSANQILNNLVSILGGLVAAITGFYFGSKAKD
jgi:hypothetical protein